MKLVANVMVLLGLIVLPLIPRAKLPRLLQAVQATRWIALTALLMIFLSLLAHRLDDAGLAVINGVEGNLHNNISEFRELNLYYLLLIYG